MMSRFFRSHYFKSLAFRSHVLTVVMMLILSSCQSSIMELERKEDLELKSDLDKKVLIEEVAPPIIEPVTNQANQRPPPLLAPDKNILGKKEIKTPFNKKSTEAVVETAGASIEDQEGFKGRRPTNDPFWIGEKITLKSYYNLFGFTAAHLTFENLPYVQVNGRKAYQFVINLKTTSLFNSIYSIDDQVITLIDYEHWLPRLYTLHVKESSQLREGRSYFDFQKMKARYEEKKMSKKKGKEEKNQQWDILPYSQNVFSVIYYMRLFAWRDAKDYSFRVADDNENLIFKGRVIAREVLDTDLGPRKAIKIKPEIILKGNFKPVGDIFIWLSDDNKKIPLRIESKIKIGTIVSEITDYQPGQAPTP